ncbi:MAG: hypothetical protein GY861_12525 [bacterium]|nr:hypothetical protein [bacterium]
MGKGKKGGNPGTKAYNRSMATSGQSGNSDTKGPLTFKRDFAKEGHPAPSSWGAVGSKAS